MNREKPSSCSAEVGADLGYMDGPEFAKFLEEDNARLWEVAEESS
jgi:hypothetical protein